MLIRECLDILARLTEASDPAVTAAFIEKAYALLNAEADLEPVSLYLTADRIFGFSNDLTNMVEVNDLEVEEDARGEGLGSKTMQIICELADQMGVTLVLRTWDSEEMDLDGWYSRFGFVGSRTMYRPPQAAAGEL